MSEAEAHGAVPRARSVPPFFNMRYGIAGMGNGKKDFKVVGCLQLAKHG